MKNILFILALLIGVGGSAQKVNNKIIHVAADLSFQNYEHFNRLVLDSEDSSAEHIEGFNFEWGYEYVLKVEETELSETLSDGTKFDYKLIEVVSKTKLPEGSEFMLFLDPEIYHYQDDRLDSRSLKKVNKNTYRYLESVDIEIPDDLMPKFLILLKSPNGQRGTFRFLDSQKILLVNI